MGGETIYLDRIRDARPDLAVRSARLHTRDGQFNDVLIVNDELVFRFPRTPHVARTLRAETSILGAIRGRTSLPVPDPIYTGADQDTGELAFMGYPMIPGEPLRRETLAAITDGATLDRLAAQLARFLRELHSVPLAALGPGIPAADGQEYWTAMYAGFRDRLFPYMRPDAREQVTRRFDSFLREARNFDYRPALRHGDFGAGNILYDPRTQSITGVIDFSSAAVGDPAVDAAAISTAGQSFLERFYPFYPELRSMSRRMQFYKGTYALQQALYALRDGDRESFQDGIKEYI